MSRVTPLNETLPRESLIRLLGWELSKRAGGRSVRTAAADELMLFGGLRAFPGNDLRPQLTRLAGRTPFDAGQRTPGAHDGDMAGNVQCEEHHDCNVWDDFSDDELAISYHHLTGRAVKVVAPEIAPKSPTTQPGLGDSDRAHH